MVLSNSIHSDDKPSVKRTSMQNLCSRCKKGLTISDYNGEIFCSNCGYVVSQRSEDPSKEWRNFSDDNGSRARTGGPTTLTKHDMGLNTTIGRSDRDSSGNPIDVSMKITMHRLRNWDSRIKMSTSTDRNLSRAFNELNRMTDKLGLTDLVAEKTAYIYRKAEEKGLTRGRSVTSLLAASVYAACRNTETPRNLNDIASACNVKRKTITRCYRLMIVELDLKMPVVDPLRYVARIANKANISERSKRKALEIIGSAINAKISSGKSPLGLVATALYRACVLNGENVTQKIVAEAAGVTEVTIRNRYKGFKAGT